MTTIVTDGVDSSVNALWEVLEYATRDRENYEALRFQAPEEEKGNYDPKFLFGDEIEYAIASVARAIDSADELKIADSARTVELQCMERKPFWTNLTDVLCSDELENFDLENETLPPRKHVVSNLLKRLNQNLAPTNRPDYGPGPPTLVSDLQQIVSELQSAISLGVLKEDDGHDGQTVIYAELAIQRGGEIIKEAEEKNNDGCRVFSAVAQTEGLNSYKIQDAKMIVFRLRSKLSGGGFLDNLIDFAETYLSDSPKVAASQESTATEKVVIQVEGQVQTGVFVLKMQGRDPLTIKSTNSSDIVTAFLVYEQQGKHNALIRNKELNAIIHRDQCEDDTDNASDALRKAMERLNSRIKQWAGIAFSPFESLIGQGYRLDNRIKIVLNDQDLERELRAQGKQGSQQTGKENKMIEFVTDDNKLTPPT